MDIERWLLGMGLGRYVEAFRANDVDERTLASLTAQDLREMGVFSVGHRRLLLQAIRGLRADSMPGADLRTKVQAERRQLTMMFADLVGSTALSARLDPEELRRLLRTYQDDVARVVGRFGGHIAKFMGDGVLAYFGWPKAHEDDALRAVRAGLDVVEEVGRLRNPAGEPLATRVGIATGLVVVGDLLGEGAAREEAVVGETPNLAARLQGLAAPGWVVIADATRKLLGKAYDLEALKPLPLKGLGAAVPAFRVLREAGAGTRFEARQKGAMLPLVGREAELSRLVERWQLARVSRGQAVLLLGEPGIGKSRLTKHLSDVIADEPHMIVRYQCSPDHADSPLWPITKQLSLEAGFTSGDDGATRLRKLEGTFRPPRSEAKEAVALLANLLGVEPDAHPILELTPRQRRDRTLAALVDQLARLASDRPVFVLFEDVHWIDPTSLELVEQILEVMSDWRLMMILTSRPARPPRLADRPWLTSLTLERVGPEISSAIMREVARGKPLPPEIEEAITRRTDGVPLFIEELTKAVLESGQLRETEGGWVVEGVLSIGDIPSSLQDSLMARLDGMGSAKEIAQIAACIGREFDRALLEKVVPTSSGDLDRAFNRLVASELMNRRRGAMDGLYAFKHALVQDAAYASLLKSRRQEVHLALLQVIERDFPQIANRQPEVVARHSELGGQMDRAVQRWRHAGELAIARSATAEAASSFSRAVHCLEALPLTHERQGQELELLTKLAPALIHVKGYAAPETGAAWARARELCRELDFSDRIGPVLFGQYVFHFVRAEFDLARRAARELFDFGCEHNDLTARLVGERNLGVTCLSMGELAEAQQHLELALRDLRPLDERSLTFAYGQDLYATGLLWLAKNLLIQGFPGQALAAAEEALRQSETLGDPNTRAFALCQAAKVFAFARDRRAVPLANAAVEFAVEQGYAQWVAEAWAVRGWLRAEFGELEAGLAELDRGAHAFRASGALRWRGTHLGLRARILTLQDRLSEAEEVLGEALFHTKRTGERWFEAELERFLGDALVRHARTAEAEEHFLRAMCIARSQGARMWELRAAISLCRLYVERRELARARDLLAPVYGWFTEGLSTPDLEDAKAVLEMVRAAVRA